MPIRRLPRLLWRGPSTGLGPSCKLPPPEAMALLGAMILVLQAAPPSSYGAINIVKNPNGNFTTSSTCPGNDGGNRLDPEPVLQLPPPQAGDPIFTELANTNNTAFTGWTFQPGAALSGTLTLNYYWSKFHSIHNSGARISASYAPGGGDPAMLRWIQMADTTAPTRPFTSPYIDFFPTTNGAQVPFYWNETQRAAAHTNNDIQDFALRLHPPTKTVVFHANAYIASWDGKIPGTVSLHDGIRWGFVAGCFATNATNTTITVSYGSNVTVLTWSTNSTGTNTPGWKVQSTTNVATQSSWQDRTNSVQQTNGTYRMEVPSSFQQEFFRLVLDTLDILPLTVPAYVRVPPEPQMVEQGHEAYLFVGAGGSEPISCQWHFNGSPLSGVTNRDLRFPHVDFTNQGAYFTTVSNETGFDTSDPVQLMVTPDTTAPLLQSAAASSNLQQVLVHFSEPVTPGTATNTFRYQLTGQSGGPVSIDIAFYPGTDESLIALVPSSQTPLLPHNQYFLQASGICDSATPPNCLPPGSPATFTTCAGP